MLSAADTSGGGGAGKEDSNAAIAYLARYMNMSVEDVHTLSRNKLTLGTLERLTASDLGGALLRLFLYSRVYNATCTSITNRIHSSL